MIVTIILGIIGLYFICCSLVIAEEEIKKLRRK